MNRGWIIVNEYLETSDPAIYAVGDAVQVKDFVTGEPTHIPLAGPANKQGRIAADNIVGRKEKYEGTQGTAVVRIFDKVVAATGANEKTLKRHDIPYLASFTHSASHAGYYPGGHAMVIKLLFSPEDGRVLGAQIIGADGVDKRIDVLASAVRFNKTVWDLQELELAYAPPFSMAKDPVNMADYVAGNILNGDVKICHWHEIAELGDKTVILDVRTEAEQKAGFIPGSINIPLDSLRARLGELPRDKEIITYCAIGLRSYIASRILTQSGFTVRNLSGGYRTWKAAT